MRSHRYNGRRLAAGQANRTRIIAKQLFNLALPHRPEHDRVPARVPLSSVRSAMAHSFVPMVIQLAATIVHTARRTWTGMQNSPRGPDPL